MKRLTELLDCGGSGGEGLWGGGGELGWKRLSGGTGRG